MPPRQAPIPLVALLCVLSLPVPALAAITLDTTDELRALLSPHLPAEASPQRLEALASEILATEGYFSPRFEFPPAADDAAQTVRISPGPRTTIKHVGLTVDRLDDDNLRLRLEKNWRLPVGKPFRQADWNEAKQQVLGELLAGAHIDARLLDSLADIDSEQAAARLDVYYDAGPAYRFGELIIDGLHRYSPELVARYNRSVTPGAPYRQADVNTLLSNLQSAPYFAHAEAQLDRAAGETDADGHIRAPLRLSLRERPAHRVGLGGGISSNTGVRIEGNYHTPNLFNQAWELASGLRLEQKKQTAYADVFFPPDQRNRVNSVGAMLEATDIQGVKTENYALGAQTVQQRGSVEQRLSLHWQNEILTPQGQSAVHSQALVPTVQWTWRRLDNAVDPRQGTILQLSVGGASEALLSDQSFLRLHGRWQQYLPLGRRDTLSLRAELGHTQADQRQHIPQDYLFRAGGTGSVRGYAYQSLGLKEGSATLGGRYLAVASAEATHWLDERWGVAAFVDAGNAVDDRENFNLKLGYGLGGRWRSPAGPVGADLAYGQHDGGLHLHFSLAIPF